MSKRIILVGHAASGKDHARKEFQKHGYTYQIGYTTRPPRKGEQHGIDYYFISEEEFQKMIDNNEMYEYVQFNNWYYGTSKKQFFEENSVFIMTPSGINHIKKEDINDCFIFYFDIPEDIRLERLKNRGDINDSITRRIDADRNDFSNFKLYSIIINDPYFSIDSLLPHFIHYLICSK